METKEISAKTNLLLEETGLYISSCVADTMEEAKEKCGGNEITESNWEKKFYFDNPEKPPTPEEIIAYTQLEMAKNIRSIKSMVFFFVALTAVSLFIGFFAVVFLLSQ